MNRLDRLDAAVVPRLAAGLRSFIEPPPVPAGRARALTFAAALLFVAGVVSAVAVGR